MDINKCKQKKVELIHGSRRYKFNSNSESGCITFIKSTLMQINVRKMNKEIEKWSKIFST